MNLKTSSAVAAVAFSVLLAVLPAVNASHDPSGPIPPHVAAIPISLPLTNIVDMSTNNDACVDQGDGTYVCRVGEFEWNPSGATSTDTNALTSDGIGRAYSSVGIYYCPASGNSACDSNGAPTSGTVDSWGRDNGDLQYTWCVRFHDTPGEISGTCPLIDQDADSLYADQAKGGTHPSGHTVTGTYGGYFEYIAEDNS